jgi:RNA 3'-terminal phosphate cyclase (ATP)
VIEIDGAMGEGGGQVLRSSLALACITGQAVRLRRIRARRSKPGLAPQHLMAVRAAAMISGATVRGDAVRSTELEFTPGPVVPGRHHFPIGTAGSTTLVLQTILYPLLLANAPSVVTIEGGTYNPLAPPFDFVARTFVPALRRMGAVLDVTMPRPGFYPVGGGTLEARIEPGRLHPIELQDRGRTRRRRATAIVSQLPISIAERELAVVRDELAFTDLEALELDAAGPGNAIVLELEHDAGSTIVSAIGSRGVRAERVAADAVEALRRFDAANVPVDEHLADQLLLPLALAGGGSFRTLAPTLHTRTNAELIGRFLPVEFTMDALPDGTTRIAVTRPS